VILEPTTYDYLIKGESGTEDKSDTYVYVYMDSLNPAFHTPGKTEKIKRKVLPLLVYWKTETTFKVAYDSAGAASNTNAFIKEGFLREMNRKARVQLTKNPDSADLFLKLDLIEIDGGAVFQKKSELYIIPFPAAALTVHKQGADILSGSVQSIMSYTLYGTDKNVLSTDSLFAKSQVLTYHQMKVRPAMNRMPISLNAAIMEAVGDTFRQHFERIITDLNGLDTKPY
jgi:hypothetical protein